MEMIKLPENHRRALSSAMMVLEQQIDHMAELVNDPPNEASYGVETQLTPKEILHALNAIGELKKKISEIMVAYNLDRKNTSQSNTLKVMKIFMWEMLEDIKAKRLSAYGAIPPEASVAIDRDISALIRLLEDI